MSAAEESAVFRRFPGGIDSLVVFLRQRGFRVGASEAIDAARLVRALASQATAAKPGDDATWLAPKLRPIFCKNRDDQQRFDAIFSEWARDGVGGPPVTQAPSAPANPPPVTGTPNRHGYLALVIALLIAAFFLYRQFNTPPSPPTGSQAPSVAAAAPRPASPSTLAVAPTAPASDGTEASFDGVFPQVRYQAQWRPWVGGALLAVFGLALCALLLPFATPWLGHAQRSGRPIALDDSSLRQEAERIVPPLATDVAARLARHVPGPADSGRRLQRRPPLDVGRTLEATLRQLGILRLRYRRARLAPSYLLLVDGDEQNDPRSRLFYHWAQRLQREGIDVDIRLVRHDPTTGGVHLRQPGGRDGEALDLLPTPPVGQRLIVISDGTLLVDEQGRPRDWLARARLHHWPERVLFTPREPRRWDAREAAIERPERSADPGFIVLPIDENALAAWSELIVSGQLPDFALSRPQRYPRLLRRVEDAAGDQAEQTLLADTPPFSAAEISDLIAQLKLYLGENGYYWLCVCAIPPIVRWQLTLLLGEQYLRNAGVDDSQLAAYIARYYGRLAGLPWLRRQKMPDWLRLALLDSLPTAIQDELRQAVLGRLGQLQPAAGGGETLHLEEPPGPLGRLENAGRPLRLPGTADPPPTDTLYLGFLAGYTPRQLILRAPRQWSAWLPQLPKTRRRGQWRDRLSAWRDRLFWRDGLAFLGGAPQRGLWLALTVATAAGGLAWLADPANLSPRWRQAVYVDQARAVALPQLGLTGELLYSPDGQRLLTLGEPQRGQLWDAGSGRPLGAPLRGEPGKLQAAFSADGRRLVSRVNDRQLDFRDGTTGDLLGPALTYPEPIAAIGFSPAGLRVVTSGIGHATRLWDGESGRPIAELLPERPADAGDLRIQFNADASRLLAASHTEGTLRLWETTTGQPAGTAKLSDTLRVQVFSPGLPTTRTEYSFQSIVLSPDLRLMAVVVLGNRIQLWNVENGQQIGRDLEHQGTIHRLRFSPDSRRLLSTSADHSARLWDAASGRPLGQPMRHDQEVYDAAFSPNSRFIATGGADRRARLWDSESGTAVGVPLLHSASVNRLAFAPDGQQLATASFNQSVRLWSARPTPPLHAVLPQPAALRRASFSPDGERLLSAGDDGNVRLWDSHNGQPIGDALSHGAAVNDARFSADGLRVVTASDDQTARLWDGLSGRPIGAPLPHQGAVRRAQFSPDGQRLVTAGTDRQARLWDGRNGQPLLAPLKHADTVNDAAFSADGKRLLTASDDGTARLWDVASGQPLEVVLVHPEPVTQAMFCADDQRIVTVSLDRRARLWDSRSGRPLGTAMSHPATISGADCSVDGRRIVTASLDNTARLWNGETGQPLGRVLRHEDAVWHVAFSPDGRRVLTASADRSARLWDGKTGEPLGAALRHAQPVRHATFSADGGRLVTAWGATASASPAVGSPAAPSVSPSPAAPTVARQSTRQSSRPLATVQNNAPTRKSTPLSGQPRVEPPPADTPKAADRASDGQPSPANSPAMRLPPSKDKAANPPAFDLPERAPQQQQAPLRGPSGASAPSFDLFPTAWANGNSKVPDQQNPPAERSPAPISVSATAKALTSASGTLAVSGTGYRGGATVWPVPPDPLPIPDSRPVWPLGWWFAGLLGAWLTVAILLAWRARRRLRRLCATDESAPPLMAAA
ncbi:MAG: hypothetical protein JNL84_14760 [Candidatus Accumulibacter sp.]|nr:hypothetical protein [Accumulibacter sp.]